MRAVHRGVRDDAIEPHRDPKGDVIVTAKAGWFDVRVVQKPWGHETIWAVTEDYVGKVLHVKAGHALSLQYHNRKDETMHVLSGELILRTRPGETLLERPFRAGESVHIPATLVHQIEAVVDTDVLEASTPELDDLVRLQDRYGRS